MLQQCEALTRVLPAEGAFAHLTAAAIYGLWLPRLPDWLPVLAVLPPGEDRPERDGLYVFRSRAAQPTPWAVRGLPVVPPAVCLGQLAEDLPLVDLVVAIDGALQANLCTISDITDALRSRQRGLPALREALTWCDGRRESPWESVLRLVRTMSGIAVEPQPDILDDFGEFIGRADLRIVGTRRLAEYDGDCHRARHRHQADLVREKALARAGWQRYGYIAREIVLTPGRIVRDAEDALEIAHQPSRTHPWQEAAGESSLTSAGRARLSARLSRFARPLRGRKAAR